VGEVGEEEEAAADSEVEREAAVEVTVSPT
jgi:hypothetical protein